MTGMRQELDDLAARAAGGDRAALDDLLREIQPLVLRRCARFLTCYQDAEEACQDVLWQVARHIDGFEGRSRFTTWLHLIVANCSRQTYRSLKRRAAERASPELLVQVADPRTTSVIAGSRIDLLDALEQLEGRRPELVAPLVLRDICELEYAQIAEHLGIPLGTLKTRIHEARQQVRAALRVTEVISAR